MTTRFTRSLLAVALAVAAASGHAYSSLVVFGDSLSDSGNNAAAIGANGAQVISGNTYVPAQPYASNTYSNANVWVNSFAAGIGLAGGAVPSLFGGGNFAFGGARTVVNGTAGPQGNFPPSAATQLGAYLAPSPAVAADSLYVVAIGGNDVRATAEAAAADLGNATAIVGAAAQAYAAGVDNIVNALQASGAGTIIVWNAPDVGKTPAALAGGPFVAGFVTSIAATFNSFLAGAMADESNVRIFDIFGQVNSLIATAPAGFNTTDACGAVAGCNPANYLYWDGIHPTSAGHAVIAAGMLQVAAVPEPGTWLLMALGLGGLLAARRRRAG